MSVTYEITKYYHPKYSITIYNTPGFEDESIVKAIYKQYKNSIQIKKIQKIFLN